MQVLAPYSQPRKRYLHLNELFLVSQRCKQSSTGVGRDSENHGTRFVANAIASSEFNCPDRIFNNGFLFFSFAFVLLRRKMKSRWIFGFTNFPAFSVGYYLIHMRMHMTSWRWFTSDASICTSNIRMRINFLLIGVCRPSERFWWWGCHLVCVCCLFLGWCLRR